MASQTGYENPFSSLNHPLDVVALVTSAGGMEAVSAIIRNLPTDLPAAVLVVQHLGQVSSLVDILKRRTQLPVTWMKEGETIQRGHIHICPPRTCVEVLPDRTYALSLLKNINREKPLSFFLESLADSFGKRALATVLTGMGKDGALGALKLKNAGGIVLVQSEDTAEQPSMPHAAIEAGSADLVLPLHEISDVINRVTFGGNLPKPPHEIEAAQVLFQALGEVSQLLREIDWAQTSLGPVSEWSLTLQMTLRMVIESPMPMIVLWGKDLVQLYNDHYRLLMGVKHPAGLGQPNRESWPEVWHLNKPLYERVFEGEAVALENALYPITRHGELENAWFNLYFTPIRNENSEVVGVLGTILETTNQVLATRRLRTLHALASETSGAQSPHDACRRAMSSLEANDQDIPFALSYLIDQTRDRANLCAAIRLESGSLSAPLVINLRGGHPSWPLAKVIHEGVSVIVDDLSSRFHVFNTDPTFESPAAAFLLPLRTSVEDRPLGVLILGISIRLPFDPIYRDFFELVSRQVSTSIAEAISRHKEKERLERLAELDRAKTEFFANVSHEFRTPLTLMLAPLEELLHQRAMLPNGLGQEVEIASRNAQRLLTLVDTLLDFSQAEAGRLRANFEPTDLSVLTADLASIFRSAVEHAGLRLIVKYIPLPEPVWIDRTMWEQIISNLLANALKFTFEGEITVEVSTLPQHVQVIVRDTGVGIPQEELPHIFKRFYRVKGTRARTYEGSGIGLALIHELVRLHQGRVRVQSVEGQGTTFTVWIPRGKRIQLEEPVQPRPDNETIALAAVLAEEARRWGESTEPPSPDVIDEPLGISDVPLQARVLGAHILVVDDNADMRDYFHRLLATTWQVESASDGIEAMEKVRLNRPDLILTDVMMPNLDGFGLLRELRQDDDFKTISIVLVTARAGEEAAIEGLLAGADDYIVKPFSARELVTRVGAQLELAKLRKKSETQFRSLVTATSDVVYKMSPDWKEMRYLNGKNFIADTNNPSRTWLETYIPQEEQSQVWSVIREAIRKKSVFEVEHRVIQVDGKVGWTFSRAIPLLDEQGEIIEWLGAASNITERKRAEYVLRMNEKRMRGQKDAFQSAINDAPLGESLDILARMAIEETGGDARIAFYIADPNAPYLHPVQGAGNMPNSYLQQIDRFAIGEDSLACGLSVATGRPILTKDVFEEPLWTPWVHLAAAYDYRGCWSFPIDTHDGKTVGTFAMYFRTPRQATSNDLALADLVTQAAAIIISRYTEAQERRRVEDALRASEEKLRQSESLLRRL